MNDGCNAALHSPQVHYRTVYESNVNYEADGGIYHDAEITWYVHDRTEMAERPEVLFRNPELARRFHRGEGWDEVEVYEYMKVMELFTEAECSVFRDWLRHHRDVDVIATKVDVPLPEGHGFPVSGLPLCLERRRIRLSSDADWDLPFSVEGAVILLGAHWEADPSREPRRCTLDALDLTELLSNPECLGEMFSGGRFGPS